MSAAGAADQARRPAPAGVPVLLEEEEPGVSDDPDKACQITVYTTVGRREELKAYAKTSGYSLSEWLLYAAAGEMVRADDAQIQAERDRLAGITRDLRTIARELRNDVQAQRAEALMGEIEGEMVS